MKDVVGEEQVIRRRLGGDADATLLRPPDQLDAAGRRDAEHMEPTAGELGELEVAVEDDLLGGRGHDAEAEAHADDPLVHDAAAGELEILGVAHDRLVEHPAIFEGAA